MSDLNWNERRKIRKQRNAARDQRIREMPRTELDAAKGGDVPENEYIGEVNQRAYWQGMNQKDLEFQATFDPYAEAELRRRKGELPR